MPQSNPCLKTLLTKKRILSHKIHTKKLSYHYYCSFIDQTQLSLFKQWIKKKDLFKKLNQTIEGHVVNPTENKAATHHQLRSPSHTSLYQQELKKLKSFIKNIDPKNQISNVVQIGTGGCYLGPKAIIESLKNHQTIRTPYFISNGDPTELQSCLNQINIKKTFFIIATKSGTTLETLTNYKQLLKIAKEKNIDISNQLIIITDQKSPLNNPKKFKYSFFINHTIGGRFSATSMMGMVILALTISFKTVNELLKGAHEMDQHTFNEERLSHNMALLDACNSIWQTQTLKHPIEAIISYKEELNHLPTHIQQLQCESLGKNTSFTNKPLKKQSTPFITTGTGTLCQHSFFQFLQQSPFTIPVQFISTKKSPLNTQLIAQMHTLALGNKTNTPHTTLPGNRPSTALIIDQQSPYAIGQLLSFYENKTTIMGILTHTNPYDQPGVEWAKKVAKQAKAESQDTLLAMQEIFKN